MCVYKEHHHAQAKFKIRYGKTGIVANSKKYRAEQATGYQVMNNLNPYHRFVPRHLYKHPGQQNNELSPKAGGEAIAVKFFYLLSCICIYTLNGFIPNCMN